MTTVTIEDELATRLRALRDKGDDLNRVVAEALAETARRWEWEAAGRAEMKKMLEGPRHTQAEVQERTRRKYGYADLSHLTPEALADQAERIVTAMTPDVRAELEREGLL